MLKLEIHCTQTVLSWVIFFTIVTNVQLFYSSESEISMERRLEMKAWLKHNNAPADQVMTFMQATVGMRAEWIRGNPDLTSLQIKTEYPRLLDTPGMVS